MFLSSVVVINSKWAVFELCQFCIQWAVCTAVWTGWYTHTAHLFSDASDRLSRFTLCVTFPFRHGSVFVPSEWSLFTLSVVFSHLPEQHVIGGQRLFPSEIQRTATECVFRYLLVIRTSVMIDDSNFKMRNIKHWNLADIFQLTYSMEQSPSWEANWFCN